MNNFRCVPHALYGTFTFRRSSVVARVHIGTRLITNNNIVTRGRR